MAPNTHMADPKRARAAGVEEATAYWRDRLSDAAHIQLPTDFPVDDTQVRR